MSKYFDIKNLPPLRLLYGGESLAPVGQAGPPGNHQHFPIDLQPMIHYLHHQVHFKLGSFGTNICGTTLAVAILATQVLAFKTISLGVIFLTTTKIQDTVWNNYLQAQHHQISH